MISRILLVISCAVAVSSCSTAYKTGQTPDDVYYSPGHGTVAIIADQGYKNRDREDRDIIMSIRDPRWRDFDDYSYTPYSYGYNYDYYYNPVYYPYPVYTTPYYCTCNCYNKYDLRVTAPVNTTPRMTNLSAYNGKYNNNNIISKTTSGRFIARPAYNNSNNNRGSALTRLFSSGNSGYQPSSSYSNNNSNSSNNNSSTDNSRSYSPSSSGNTSSSSGGSISRPSRNH